MLPPFVKKFDFRGVYNTDITDRDSYYLGLALHKTLYPQKVLVGWDTRVSSNTMARRFMSALQSLGTTVVYTPQCPIDYVTAGADALDVDLSVMFTGSHNPWDWTGLLMHTKGGASIQGDLVTTIVNHFAQVQDYPYEQEDVPLSAFENVTETIEALYAQKLASLLPMPEIKPLSVLVDIGDGSGDPSLKVLEKLLPHVRFTRINNRGVYDEHSSHTADPSEIKNMQDLIHEMQQGSYDCGFAFDSDADRVLGVDETGAYINGSLLGSAMVETFVAEESDNRLYGYAVDCGPSFHNTVVSLNQKEDLGLHVQPLPVGRSFMRNMLRDKKIDMGIENVGHFYCRDFFMTDSGVFSLAVVLYWMSLYGPLSSLFEKCPDGKRRQIFLPLSETPTDTDTHIHTALKALYPDSDIKTISVDGIRYEILKNGTISSWFSMRQSGYEALQKYFYGSLNDEDFIKLQETINAHIKKA